MWTKVTAFILGYVLLTYIAFAITGEQAFAATSLTSGISSGTTTIPVASTANFIDSGFIFIGNEEIRYTSKTATSFNGITRGQNKTDPESYVVNTEVFSKTTSTLNTLAGYNVLVRISDLEGIAVVTAPFVGLDWFFRAFRDIVLFNYPFFIGDLWGTGIPQAFQFVLIASSVGFIMFLVMVIFRGGAS